MTYRDGDIDPVCRINNPGLDEYRDGCCRFPKSCSPHMNLARAVELNTRDKIADEVSAYSASQQHDPYCAINEFGCTCTWRARTRLLDSLADRIVEDGLR